MLTVGTIPGERGEGMGNGDLTLGWDGAIHGLWVHIFWTLTNRLTFLSGQLWELINHSTAVALFSASIWSHLNVLPVHQGKLTGSTMNRTRAQTCYHSNLLSLISETLYCPLLATQLHQSIGLQFEGCKLRMWRLVFPNQCRGFWSILETLRSAQGKCKGYTAERIKTGSKQPSQKDGKERGVRSKREWECEAGRPRRKLRKRAWINTSGQVRLKE